MPTALTGLLVGPARDQMIGMIRQPVDHLHMYDWQVRQLLFSQFPHISILPPKVLEMKTTKLNQGMYGEDEWQFPRS